MNHDMPQLKTKRLILREFTQWDAPASLLLVRKTIIECIQGLSLPEA